MRAASFDLLALSLSKAMWDHIPLLLVGINLNDLKCTTNHSWFVSWFFVEPPQTSESLLPVLLQPKKLWWLAVGVSCIVAVVSHAQLSENVWTADEFTIESFSSVSCQSKYLLTTFNLMSCCNKFRLKCINWIFCVLILIFHLFIYFSRSFSADHLHSGWRFLIMLGRLHKWGV